MALTQLGCVELAGEFCAALVAQWTPLSHAP